MHFAPAPQLSHPGIEAAIAELGLRRGVSVWFQMLNNPDAATPQGSFSNGALLPQALQRGGCVVVASIDIFTDIAFFILGAPLVYDLLASMLAVRF